MHGIAKTETLRAWIDFLRVHEELGAEVVRASEVNADPSVERHRRRIYVRSVFAYIEAITFCLKRGALATSPETFTASEKLMLEERSVGVNDKGEAQDGDAKIRLAPNVRFALGAFARIAGRTDPIDVGGVGWRSLNAAIKVRDRITHPRTPASLVVSDQDYADVNAGFGWFSKEFVAAASDAARALEGYKDTPRELRPWRKADESETPEFKAALAEVHELIARINTASQPARETNLARRLVTRLETFVFGPTRPRRQR